MLSSSHTGSSVIEVQSLYKKYAKSTVLENIHFAIAAGESVGLVGPNGAGKSTLIKIILGLVQPTSGATFLLGEASALQGGSQKVSYLPELPGFWPEISAYEYLQFSRKLLSKKPQMSVQDLLARVGLKERGKRPMGTYSKGMIQRTGIAWALQREPDLYILDEPMSGLDPKAQALLREILKEEQAQGRSLFISSHSFDDIQALCSRVLVINHQKIEHDDKPSKVFEILKKEYASLKGWDEDYDS